MRPPTAILSFLLLGLVFCSTVSALCTAYNGTDHRIKFPKLGLACNGEFPLAKTGTPGACTSCCRNFQACINSTCTQVYQGMNCTTDEQCGVNDWNGLTSPSTLYCVNNPVLGVKQCNYRYQVLENGAFCVANEQCMVPSTAQIGSCTNMGNDSLPYTCNPAAGQAGASCVAPGDCGPKLWCNSSATVAGVCVTSLGGGADCTAAMMNYASIPNWVCPSGYGCAQVSTDPTALSYQCVKYYSQTKLKNSKQGAVCSVNNWWNCQYSYYCTANTSTINATIGHCTLINQVGSSSCKTFPLTNADFDTCLWGTTCDCFLSSNYTTGQCERLYNTNCPQQLTSLQTCISKYNCPHDARQLIGGSSEPFTGSILAGSCIDTNCRTTYDNLILCQNLDINNYRSPAFVPTAGPNSHYNTSSAGLEGWEIGLIIVGIAVAVIIVVVVVVAVVRRRSKSDYQPLE